MRTRKPRKLVLRSPAAKTEILDVHMTAELLTVSTDTVYDLFKKGDLPARKVGRKWLTTRTAVLRWIEHSSEQETMARAIEQGDAKALAAALTNGQVQQETGLKQPVLGHALRGRQRCASFLMRQLSCRARSRRRGVMASQIEIRQCDDGTLLGYFYAALEPDAIRQLLTAEGLRALAEDVGIYIPEINDPRETPFYHWPDILVGAITVLESSAYQTILDRE